MKKKIKQPELTPTQKTVIDIASEYAEVLVDDISLDSKWYDDLGIDSLDGVDIVLKVEETFGIELPDQSLEHVDTVGELAELIDSLCDGTL